MAKEFAFLFYVNDWAGGTQWMSRLQRGGYLDLLLFQVNNTSFSLDQIKKVLGPDFEEIWPGIKDKFLVEDGLFFNKKMREVLAARIKFSESRRANKLGKTKDSKPKKLVKKTSKSLGKLVGKEKEREKEVVNEFESEGENKEPKILLTMPFGEDFSFTWDLWKQYKIDHHKFKYKTILSEQAALNELVELANGKEETACLIIRQSMAKGWQGLFELKNNQKNGSEQSISKVEQRRRQA